MSAPRDHYEVLGVSRTATAEEIRRAHRKLAREFHPDMNKEPAAAARFAEVQAAYDVLSDPEKRSHYDRFGDRFGNQFSPGGTHAHAGGRGGTGSWRVEVDPADFASVFQDIFGSSGHESVGPFGRSARAGRTGPGGPRGGTGGHASERVRRGDDVEMTLDVDFMTAALGGTRIVHPNGGERIEVRVPPGAERGATLRVAGKGRPGRGGGPAGDLLLAINIAPHPWFRREGNDIVIDIPISIVEAALGTTVTIPLLRGSVDLKVPPGTSSGRRLRVRGQGIVARSGVKGDFLAQISIVAPPAMLETDRDLLREIGERLPDPRADLPWNDDGGAAA